MCVGAAFSPDVLHLTNDYVLASDIDYVCYVPGLVCHVDYCSEDGHSSYHDFVFFHLHAANVCKPHAMSLLFRTTHCRRRYVDGILFCPTLHT